jgi:hypothetical protein
MREDTHHGVWRKKTNASSQRQSLNININGKVKKTTFTFPSGISPIWYKMKTFLFDPFLVYLFFNQVRS